MAELCDCVVIGAGVIGLAAARELARAGRDVLVIERREAIGAETSSRNSEVVHAGIYYPPGSLKALLCVRGKALLYAHCDAYGIAHRRLGKLIVAASETQRPILDGYLRRARANGVGDLVPLDRNAVRELEPQVDAVAGLYSPSTGILDSHAYMLSLQGDIEAAGGAIALRTEVADLRRDPDGMHLRGADFALRAALVVNAAGLAAPALASRLGGRWRSRYAKGRYYMLSGKAPFSHLVYPVAEAGGLGVHVTLDLAGQARFGPDVSWQDDADCSFDDSDAVRQRFAAAIRRYYPDLDASRLQPGYAGIRPKLAPDGAPPQDFVIEGPDAHGVPGLVNLLGIESPGLTASLAIAERVAALARQAAAR